MRSYWALVVRRFSRSWSTLIHGKPLLERLLSTGGQSGRESAMQSDPPIVLIVDAHEDSLAMYAIGLSALGFQPVTAKDAEQALGQAWACHPEVVVVALII